MAKLVIYGKLFRDSLKAHVSTMKIAAAGAGVVGAGLMVQGAMAVTQDYSFINDTLQGLGTALLGFLPLAGQIMDAGGPVMVKGVVYFAIIAGFLGVAYWVERHTK